jgi:hypothetical protein
MWLEFVGIIFTYTACTDIYADGPFTHTYTNIYYCWTQCGLWAISVSDFFPFRITLTTVTFT